MSLAFPTSNDIFIEANGKKIAVVQGYNAVSIRNERVVEAFGESSPVATVAGMSTYKIELSRLYATDEAISDGINFHDLTDFSLAIVKPDRRIVYTGCEWSEISENGQLSEMVAERVMLVAKSRVEIES